MSMRRIRARLALIVVCVGMLCLGRPLALGAVDEYPVKAAFVYNFVQFVEWPAGAFANPKAPLEITILGQDPFNGALDRAVAGKTANGHPLVVKHVGNANDLQRCHVLFVPAPSQDQFSSAQQKLGSANLLTIGEADNFNDSGGVIHLYTDSNHIRFDISRGAAEKAALHVSAKLLKLAKTVTD